MACRFSVIVDTANRRFAPAAIEALDEVDRLETQLSVYRDDSELARLNRTAAAGPVAVERRLVDLLARAFELSRATDGAFDVTAGPLVRCWGFFHRRGRVPDEGELAEARGRVGYQHVEVDAAGGTVRFRVPGMEINLGSIGKGYALDRAAEPLRDAGLADYLIHGGRSSVLAHGNQRGRAGWTIGIRNPLFLDEQLAVLHLGDLGMGTSGSAEQFFRRQGQRFGHILDPRSGRPAEGMLSAVAVAATAAEADALATAFFILGVDKSRAFCENRPGVGALLIPQPKQGRRLQVIPAGVVEACDNGPHQAARREFRAVAGSPHTSIRGESE
jgi:thiamine biosynthesis lipoprotein